MKAPVPTLLLALGNFAQKLPSWTEYDGFKWEFVTSIPELYDELQLSEICGFLRLRPSNDVDGEIYTSKMIYSTYNLVRKRRILAFFGLEAPSMVPIEVLLALMHEETSRCSPRLEAQLESIKTRTSRLQSWFTGMNVRETREILAGESPEVLEMVLAFAGF